MNIALVVSDSNSAWYFRRNLIAALLAEGHRVTVVTPCGPRISDLLALGAHHVPIKISRFFSPIADVEFTWSLYCIMRRHRFDIVQNFSIKPNTLGAIAEKLAGVPRIIGSITGLGYSFAGERRGASAIALQAIVRSLYWIGLRLSCRVWFQNEDDLEFLASRKLVGRGKSVVIPGSGVDTAYFDDSNVAAAARSSLIRELGMQDSDLIVTLVARPLNAKGIKEFIDAAVRVESEIPSLKFLLVGEHEADNPDNVPMSYITSRSPRTLRFLGWRSDVREILAISSIVVLPSYREGLPKSLVEALAMAKPIVTTDVPGCREMIVNGGNGILIPPRNAVALADAIVQLSAKRDRFPDMGAISRTLACGKFDDKIVVAQLVNSLYTTQAHA